MRRPHRSMPALLAGTILALLAGTGPSPAQESASLKIKTPVLNNGGRPLDGALSSSASYLLRPDAIGEGVVEASATSASFRLAGGFLQAFRPPGEVEGLEFTDSTTMVWTAEPFANSYNLYRAGPMGEATAVAPVGNCQQAGVTGVTTADLDVPPAHQAYFYFVNAVNCTRIEGPDGTIGARCP